jgi:hypothetical protein
MNRTSLPCASPLVRQPAASSYDGRTASAKQTETDDHGHN